MLESIFSTINISFIIVFLEGILSFFSPCIIPLIPVYMSYLAGNTEDIGINGEITYNKSKVFLHTIFFVFGISFAFFILGFSFTTIGSFFQGKQLFFTRIAGIVIVLLGLHQLGFFEFSFLNIERKFHMNINKRNVNPFVAFIMGFTFSFAWTPCVGPALSSVLILSSTASSAIIGNTLVLLYSVGFVIPFLILGLFTTQVLNFLHNHQKFLKYTVKTGGIILVIMGIMTFTGWLNGVSGYLNSLGFDNVTENNNQQQEPIEENSPPNEETTTEPDKEESTDSKVIPAFDFVLTDQYGNTHTLSDYKGKVVFLNFWATWCPPCQMEMPDIEALYIEYNENQDDVVFLGVANPRNEENTNTREVEKDEVIAFLEENEYTFPVVFDETGEIYAKYNISALPTTFLIDKQGNIQGYAPGMLTKDIMKSVIEETLKINK
ncbi:MAG: cytochrome c biogenesis protein CcdA [Sedimentibacter sp.]